MTYQSVGPHNGQVLEIFEELSDDDLDKGLALATGHFEAWRHMTFAERAAAVGRAPAIMRSLRSFGSSKKMSRSRVCGRELSALGIQEFVNDTLVPFGSIDEAKP